MNKIADIQPIAVIRSDFKSKFGIPRQSGLAKDVKAVIEFLPEYRDVNAVRGIDGYSHLWLIWEFSQSIRSQWSPTVKPPRLGGNARMGVFATRSPFRPNPIGLSCVKLEEVELHPKKGPLLHVSGADLLDGTPIYDTKPYVKYSDCHADAVCGFADLYADYALEVVFPEEERSKVAKDKLKALIQVLAQDPRPTYQQDPNRIYGLEFADYEVKFTVENHVLTVYAVEERTEGIHKVKWKS